MATTSLNCKRKSKGSGKDWISNLPNELLCQILSYLSTKNSVRTSVLSKHWRNLWLHVPVLELDTDNFTDDCDFWEFFDKFLELKEELDLKRFKLVYNVGEHFHEDFVPRIDGVIKRRVRHLSVLNKVHKDEALVRMPLSLYSCVTLASLVLYGVVLDAPVSNLVSVPNLKTMHLEAVKFDGKSLLGKFISKCSVLEDLTIVTHPGDYLGVIRVSSQSLKYFKLKSERSYTIIFEDEDPEDPSVIIEAPRLEFMSIIDYQCFIIYNIGPFAKVNVDFIFKVNHDDSLGAKIRNFLTGLSTVHELTISDRTLEVRMIQHLKLG